jgi:hypothetical protein
MQTPLENISDDVSLVISLLYGPATRSHDSPTLSPRLGRDDADSPRVTQCKYKSVYKLDRRSLDSGAFVVNFSTEEHAPVTAGFLSFGSSPPKKKPVEPECSLQGDLIITKIFRRIDLEKVLTDGY